MTPKDILDVAVSQFPILYLDAETVLPLILIISLGVYQDKAGVIETVKTPDDSCEVARPANILSIACVEDASGLYHEAVLGAESITVIEKAKSRRPYTISYLVNLRGYTAEQELPASVSSSLILDHVIASIDILNTHRARRVAMSTGQENDYPSDQELRDRRAAIETSMEETATDFIPIITIR
ncbi:MAG TPA: hypothetical protein ENN86_02505 [Desulfobacteraceae bacterium]|nr:hypothetical protein [Desulfobacteraceae bacterium]